MRIREGKMPQNSVLGRISLKVHGQMGDFRNLFSVDQQHPERIFMDQPMDDFFIHFFEM